jgi:hypothetical protein
MPAPAIPVEHLTRSIRVLRGQRVLLDAELAELYGVTTARLNQQVRRNRRRFPTDFLLEITPDELANLKLHFSGCVVIRRSAPVLGDRER